MLKYLRFDIGGYFGGFSSVRLWIYKYSAKYEILHISDYIKEEIINDMKEYELLHSVAMLRVPLSEIERVEPPKMPELNKRIHVKHPKRLLEWDALNVNSWDDYYYEPVCDGTQWKLTYREDGKKTRHVSGSNGYPPNWHQFIEWLDTLMPEMQFVREIEEEDIDEDGDD